MSDSNEVLLSRSESALLKDMTAPGTKITMAIPDNASTDDMWRNLDVLVKACRVVNRTHGKLLPLIGRTLLVFKSRPELYESRGYKTFAEFLARGVQQEMGLTSTDGHEAIRLVQRFPSLTLEEYMKVPRRSWQKMVQITDQSSPSSRKLIEVAAQSTTEDFVRHLEETGLLNKGEGTTVTFTLVTTLDVFQEIHHILGDPAVQASNATADKAQIVLNALREAYVEWVHQGQQQVAS